MSGKRYRQRRRFMRTWAGHPNARALWWGSAQPPLRIIVPPQQLQSWMQDWTRDRYRERALMYGLPIIRDPRTPVLSGVTIS